MSFAPIEIRSAPWRDSVVADKPNEEVGRRLKAYREAAGLKQDEAAEAADIKPITLSRYERGVVAALNTDTLKKLGHLYGKTVDQIMGETAAGGVEIDAPRSPYPEVEAFIADEERAGRPIDASHLTELRGVRFYRATVLSPYETAASLLASLRARERGKGAPKRPVR